MTVDPARVRINTYTMKKLNAKIIGFVSAALLALALVGTSSFTTGCTTVGTGTGTNVTQKVDIDKVALGLQLVTKTGTQVALSQKPGTRVYFVASVEALNTFVLTSTNTSPAALEVALNKLPVAELKSVEAQLAISVAIDAYAMLYGDTAKASISQNEAAVKLLTATRDGISQGLALVPAPAGFKLGVVK